MSYWDKERRDSIVGKTVQELYLEPDGENLFLNFTDGTSCQFNKPGGGAYGFSDQEIQILAACIVAGGSIAAASPITAEPSSAWKYAKTLYYLAKVDMAPPGTGGLKP